MRNRLASTLAGIVIASLFIAAMACASAAEPGRKGSPGPDFTLTNQDGRAFGNEDLKGKASVLFFGFTHCPDICPTTLYEFAGHLAELGKFADDIAFVFITADPERDTAEILKAYIESFDTRIVGLTGTPASIAKLAAGLGATYRKKPLESGGYTVEHVVYAYLLDRDWRHAGTLYVGAESSRQRVQKKLRELIGAVPAN